MKCECVFISELRECLRQLRHNSTVYMVRVRKTMYFTVFKEMCVKLL